MRRLKFNKLCQMWDYKNNRIRGEKYEQKIKRSGCKRLPLQSRKFNFVIKGMSFIWLSSYLVFLLSS